MKQLLQSFGIGLLIVASLWGIAMLAARHQEGVFGTVGYVIAGIIDFPIIMLYGADPRTPPSLLISIGIYLGEAVIVGLLVYLLYFARR